MLYVLIACFASAAGMARGPLWGPAAIAVGGLIVAISMAGGVSAAALTVLGIFLVFSYAVYAVGWLVRYVCDRHYRRA